MDELARVTRRFISVVTEFILIRRYLIIIYFLFFYLSRVFSRMPFYRKKKKTRRRPVRRYRRKTPMIRNMGMIMPPKLKVTLPYGDKIQLNSGVATSATHVFRANSLFDPDFSGVGHQPLGHDEYVNFYNHYTVIGSKITATFMPTGASSTGQGLCAIALIANSAGAAGGVTPLLERKGVVWKTMSGNYGGKFPTLNHFYSASKFHGVTDPVDNDDLRGEFGVGNPTEGAFFHVVVAGQDDTSNPDAIDVIVKISYIAVLQERKALIQS